MTGPAVPVPTGPAQPAPGPAAADGPAVVSAARRQREADLRGWLRGPVPRVAVLTLLVAAVLGVGQGALWARIAPLPPYIVYKDGTSAGLPTVSSQLFIGIAIYTLMGLVIGIVLASGVWRIRRVRGTFTLLAVTGSAAVGAWLAYVVGNAMTSGVDPASIGATGAASLVSALPGHYALAIVAEPALAAAVYTFLAAWNGSAQLGRPRATASVVTGPAGPVTDVPLTAASQQSAQSPQAAPRKEPLTVPVPTVRPVPPAGPTAEPGRRADPPTGPLTPPGT